MLWKLLWPRAGVKDPVCGARVSREGALTDRFVGEIYYFCSTECRDRFRALPARYLETGVRLTDSASSGGTCC